MAGALAALTLIISSTAYGIDPFRTSIDVPPPVAAEMLGKSDICRFASIGDPLTLPEAIERALCNNPKTREAWANIKVQAAAIGIAKSAFLPALSGSLQETRDHAATDVINQPFLNTSQTSTQRAESLSLNWVLFDFGGRRAALDNAVALFSAARANQQATLQSTFATVAKDYYAAQAAQSALAVTADIERTAEQSFQAAKQRVARGVAPISDELQAQSSAAQAVFNRVRASGDLQIALGTLASDMTLNTYTPLRLPDVGDESESIGDFKEAVAALIEDAKRSHPTVVAAQAQVDAAEAKARQARLEYLPSLSIVGRDSRNRQPISPGFGEIPVPAKSNDTYIGLQLTIPLFEGFSHVYQARQAEAQSEVQRAVLSETEQKVGLDVWSSYQILRVTTDNLSNSAALLAISQRSYIAARSRYESGVGTIIELLNAQSTLATSQRQRVQSLSDWKTARLQLAGALGKLSTWSENFAH